MQKSSTAIFWLYLCCHIPVHLYFARAMKKIGSIFPLLSNLNNTIIYLASILMIWNGSKITVMKFISVLSLQLPKLQKRINM